MDQASPKRAETIVLLTAFGPFPGVPENASSVLVPQLADAARRQFYDAEIVTQILPTVWTKAAGLLEDVLQQKTPDICLHFGVSDRANGFVIETRAYNTCELTEDATGRLPPWPTLTSSGPAEHNSTFPASDIVTALTALGATATASTDPGRYLCNAVLYHSLQFDADLNLPACTGFVHIPTAFATNETGGEFTFDKALSGALEILATCLAKTNPPAKHG